MAQDIVNKNQDISYTNLDFSSIYTEVVNLAKQLSYRWDPSISDESDPGVVLLKLSALIADKMNYNIDKSVLESFPLSVTQEGNARQLYEQLGYYMNWYEAATVPVNITWVGDKLTDEVMYTIPRFTIVTDSETSLSYVIVGTIKNNRLVISDVKLPTDGSTIQVVAMEGTPTTFSFLGETKITSQMIDENNRLYFETKYIAQNGIFIRNIGNNQDNYLEWQRVDNLYEQPYDGLRYKFGVDSASDVAYLEFPDNYAELIGSGIEIVYLIIDPEFNNIPPKTIDRFLVNISPQEDTGIALSVDNTKIENPISATGHKNVESIDEAYTNYKRTVGTFKTLITLRDYLNYILLEGKELCSNGFVTDRATDPQSSYKIMSKINGIDSLINEVESNDVFESVNIGQNDFDNDGITYYTYNMNNQNRGYKNCTQDSIYNPNETYYENVRTHYYNPVNIDSFEQGVEYYTSEVKAFKDSIGSPTFEVAETYDDNLQYFIKLDNMYESVEVTSSTYEPNKYYYYHIYYDDPDNPTSVEETEFEMDDSPSYTTGRTYYELVNIYRTVNIDQNDFGNNITYYTCKGSVVENNSQYTLVDTSITPSPVEGVQYFVKEYIETYRAVSNVDEDTFNANKIKYWINNYSNNKFNTATDYNQNEIYFKPKTYDVMTPFSLKFYLLQDAMSVMNKNNFNQTFEMIASEDLPSINALIEDTAHIEHTYEDILPLGKNTYRLTTDTEKLDNKSYYRYNPVGDVYEFISNSFYELTDDKVIEKITVVDPETGESKEVDKSYYKYNVQYDYYYKVDKTQIPKVKEPGDEKAERNPRAAKLYELCLVDDIVDINPQNNHWYEIDVEALMPHIAYFRAKYPIHMTITTYSVVGNDVQQDIKANILNALYQNVNSSQLEFGERIELDYLTDIVLKADTRIKSVVFDNITYEIEAMYYDEHKKQFVGVMLPYKLELPEHYDDEASVMGYVLGKDIVAKSILAGTTKLLDEDTQFVYHLNQVHIYNSPEDNIYTITPETVINMDDVAMAIDSNHSLVKNYTLKENELIKIFRPKLTNVNSYETGVHYEYLIFSDIAPNQSYKLSKHEFMILYTTQLDANGNVTGYNGKVYTNGAVIKPSFNLNAQPAQEGLSEYFKTQWEDLILRGNDSVYNCDTTSVYWTSIIQNSSSIINNVIQGNNSIIAQELNMVTITPNDGYNFYWVLNNEKKAEVTGKKFYELFSAFDSSSDTDKRNNGLINSYTLKSGETLYYADKDFKNIAILHEGTTITRNCGINSEYEDIDSDELLNYILYDENIDIITINDDNGLPIPRQNGFYEGTYVLTNDETFDSSKKYYKPFNDYYVLSQDETLENPPYYELNGYVPTTDEEFKPSKEYYVLMMKSSAGLYEYKNDMYTPCGSTTYDIFEPVVIDEADISINPSSQHFYERVNINGYTIEDTYRAQYLDTTGEDDSDYEDISMSHPRYVVSTNTTLLNENIFTDLYNSLQANDVSTYENTVDITPNNAYQYSPFIENLYEVTLPSESDDYYEFYIQTENYVEISGSSLIEDGGFDTSGLTQYYELDANNNYVLTEDLTPNSNKTYYEVKYEPVEDLTATSNPVQNGWYEKDDQDVFYLSTKCYAYKPINATKCETTSPFEKLSDSLVNGANYRVGYYYYKFANNDVTYRLRTDNDRNIPIAASGNNIQNRLYTACYSINSSSVSTFIDPTKVDTLWDTRWSERYPSSFKRLNFVQNDIGTYYFVPLTNFEQSNASILANNSNIYYPGVISVTVSDQSEYSYGFFINNATLFNQIMGRDPVNADKYVILNTIGGAPNPDASYESITGGILSTWYAGVSKVGQNYINCFPLFIVPIYYKLKYLVSVNDNYYYKLKTFAQSSFGTIDPWSCDSLSSDYIIDNPIVNLADLWQPVQNNCSITITENDMITLSEGDTISIMPDSSSAEYIKYPVFSNTEIILNLDNYNVNYITANNTLNSLEKIDIPGLDWRAYSSLLLNTSDVSGQTVQPNHSIKFMNKDGDVVYNIPNDINIDENILNNQQIKFQLKSPVNNKTGSNIQVFTYDDLLNEIPNAVYVFYNVYDNNNVTYNANGETILKFNLNNIEISGDDVSDTPRYIALPLGLPVGEYLLPLNAKKGVDVRAEMTDYIDTYTQADVSQGFVEGVTYYEKNENDDYVVTLDESPQTGKVYYVFTKEQVQIQLTSFTDTDLYEFTGDKTYYLYIHIRDIDTEGMHELDFFCDEAVNIVLGDIFKFSPNASLLEENVYDDVFTKVKLLDPSNVYNYTFQPNANDLIDNPLLPTEFWNKNHVFNKNTIAQLDLSTADNLTYRFITSR